MGKKKDDMIEAELQQKSLQDQKLELIKLRIKNKYYDRDEIIQKVIQEIYERDLKKGTLN